MIFLLVGVALAKGNAILGTVVDRNGEPMQSVNVSLSPVVDEKEASSGETAEVITVEIITDETGSFRIDYLRDSEGNRIKLAKRTTYALTLFSVGYHEESIQVEYRRGELVLEPILLEKETIRVDNAGDNIDPSAHPDGTQSSGGSYEGE